MIGEVHDDGVPAQAQDVERLEQSGYLRIGVHDFTGVRGGCLATEFVRRFVRKMRVVEMNPEVKRALGAPRLPQPCDGRVDDRSRRPLDVRERAALEARVVEQVVVHLVALADAPTGMENVGRDERCGPVACGQEPVREGGGLLAEHEAAVVAHGVVRRIQAREERRV